MSTLNKLSKTASNTRKTIKRTINKRLDGPFDKYNLFENIGLDDHCWTEGGTKIDGPGIICWIFIFYNIIINVISLLMINEYRKIGLTDKQIFIRYSLQLLFACLMITFMYSMCKRCRGLEGVLILVLLSFIQGIISMGPFISKITKEIKSLKGNNVLNKNTNK